MIITAKMLEELRKALTAPTSFLKVREDTDLNEIGITVIRYVIAREATKKAQKKDE